MWHPPTVNEIEVTCCGCGAVVSAAECLRRKSRTGWVFAHSQECADKYDALEPESEPDRSA